MPVVPHCTAGARQVAGAETAIVSGASRSRTPPNLSEAIRDGVAENELLDPLTFVVKHVDGNEERASGF